MTYDYLTINFASVAGIVFLLIFLLTNSSLEKKIQSIFFLLILMESIEMITYSLELWTTTFEHLSILRLWLSAIGYTVRPIILCLLLLLATRNTSEQKFPKLLFVPAVLNTLAAFSVFFTDIVYSYTANNQFQRGPLGYFTHVVAVIYLICLIIIVFRGHRGRSKLETLIIFAISLLIMISTFIEAAYSVRTIGRTAIVLVIIFYYMFFQTQVYKSTLQLERDIRLELEQSHRIDEVTGLLNKKGFVYAAQMVLASFPESSVAFIFVDLDHLKKINDTLGHSAGDMAIEDAADTLQKFFRKTDLLGRFGGDEFCILLMDMPQIRLRECLDEILEKLERTYTEKNQSVTVTASIGAAYAEKISECSYEGMMQFADEALYEAKASGRNCYVMKNISQ